MALALHTMFHLDLRGTRGQSSVIGASSMIDSNSTEANTSNLTVFDGDAISPTSLASTHANTKPGDGRTLLKARCIRSRKGRRSQRNLGETVTVELRDGRRVSATVVDKSASGLGVKVTDSSLFHCGQRVAVRERGVRAMAEIRNLQSEGEQCRLALKLLQA
jgi:hypothetical protein